MLRFDLVNVSQGEPGGTPGGVRREPTGFVGFLQQREMRVDLAGEIVIRPPQAEQVQQAFDQTAHRPDP
jgi:hypothetical protein